MGIIRFAIDNPVKVLVGVILVTLFGVLSVFQIPIQLTPNVDEPRISVTTFWEGASPQEVEREIIDRQEDKLKSVTGLRKMISQATENQGVVALEFFVGVDKNIALRDVSDKLRQVSRYPPEVDEPVVVAADAALASPIAWLVFRCENPRTDVSTLRDFVDDKVRPILERVDGLASIDIYGGREREVQIRIDPGRVAARRLTFRDVERALQEQNTNISAGTIAQGRRDYTYRTVGQYETTEEILDTVIAYQSGGPVFIRDVVKDPEPDGSRPGVEIAYKKQYSFVRSTGEYVLALPVRRETGANVIQVMDGLRRQIDKVNRELLGPRGMGLELTQVYDETTYITSAIGLVRNNLIFGSALAIIVLLVFLRSGRATLVVAASIPISVIATLLAIAVMGRNLNVVMLAGLAFAVGMVVDNAIVVLENIFRHREMGKRAFDAAYEGAREVWGAVLASTLTTMAVFLPVVFVKEEAGQLFRDIAIALATGVGMSLVVAMLVIPMLSARMLRRAKTHAPGAAATGGRFAAALAGLVFWINRRLWARLAVIGVLTLASLYGSVKLAPPTDYLPTGNRNLVFGFLICPPGYSLDRFREIASTIERDLRKYWDAEPGSPEAEALPPVPMRIGVQATGPGGPYAPPVEVRPSPIDNQFFVAFNGRCFMGATSKDAARVRPLIHVMERASRSVVGTFPIFLQTSLFGRIAGGNTIDLEIRGDDLEKVTATAGQLFGLFMQKFGRPPQPDPNNFNLGRPEYRFVPDRVKAADLGLTVRDVGFIVSACVDGAYVGGFRHHGDDIDMALIVDGTQSRSIQDVAETPIYTPTGKVVPLSAAVEIEATTAPEQINHIEEMPAVTLTIRAPEGMPLETAMTTVQNDIVAPLRAAGRIDPSVIITQAGNADKLVQTRNALFGQWTGFNVASVVDLIRSRGFLALVVTYLLMAALFESFTYPFVILFSVPLATVGGFMALALVHFVSTLDPVTPIQQLDVLTMLGFVILIGVVVNNAILIVHQALNNIRDAGLPPQEAIRESVRTRVRPIFMSAFTSIFGMLPLVVMPGAGSELYRGLGAVVLGGLLVSTVFTLVLVPALLSLVMDARAMLAGALRNADAPPHRGESARDAVPGGVPIADHAPSSSP